MTNEEALKIFTKQKLCDARVQCMDCPSKTCESCPFFKTESEYNEAIKTAVRALEMIEDCYAAYHKILNLLGEGFEVRLVPDESIHSLLLQIRKDNYVEDRHIGLFTLSPDYDIAFALSAMEKDFWEELYKGEKENGQDTDL